LKDSALKKKKKDWWTGFTIISGPLLTMRC